MLLDGIGPDGEITQSAKDQVDSLLHHTFRPEFLNRLDEIVFYKPLTKENITGIIDLQIDALNKRLSDKQLHCELTEAAKQLIIDTSYGRSSARVRCAGISSTVETLIARRFSRGSILPERDHHRRRYKAETLSSDNPKSSNLPLHRLVRRQVSFCKYAHFR